MNAVAPSTRKLIKLAENALQKQRNQEAYQLYQQVLMLNPHHGEALFKLGWIMHSAGQYDAATLLYERSLQENPKHFESYKMLCEVYASRNQNEQAVRLAEQSTVQMPQDPKTYGLVATMLTRFNNVHVVPTYLERVLPQFPADATLHQLYCIALKACNRFEEAEEAYRKLTARLRVDPVIRITFETMLSRVNLSNEQIERERKRFIESVEKFTKEKPRVLAESLANMPLFALAYHNRDNRDIMRAYTQMLRTISPELTYIAAHCKEGVVRREGPIRVGFISQNMHNHAVGICYRGLLLHLAKSPDFEVTFFNLANVMDSGIQQIIDAGIPIVSVHKSIAGAQEQLASYALDILIYPDIGMDARTHYLAMARLAPYQACLSGHPETTGIDTVDYVIASRTYEPENAQANYCERLLCLEGLGIVLKRPTQPTQWKTRRDFGLPEDKRLYMCPMAIQKFHPDFDHLLADILKQDDQSVLVLFSDFQQATATEMLKKRIFEVCDPARIYFMPWLALADFQSLLVLVDALLDTIYFAGGTTSQFAFDLGVPIITMPGRFARGRAAYSYYKIMEIEDAPIAKTPEEYVAAAIRVAKDPTYREKLKQQIIARNERLFEQDAEIDDFSQLMRDIVGQNLDAYAR